MNNICIVEYKYKRPGNFSWTSSGGQMSGFKSKSETLVMQRLREKHKDCEIELKKIDWR